MARFIFITGGVISSLGKGLAAASLGALLKARGFRVCLRKLDPYLNVDPGTLSPYQHGEVYVTQDGTETDLDLGHYERFAEVNTSSFDYTTTGKIYLNVLNKERHGNYLGATVQVIPHITNEIKDFLQKKTEDVDFVICEIGGTVGDIESLPFLEAIRQFRHEQGALGSLFIHVALVPYIATAGESKTKPVQHSVKELQHAGIQPDLLLCRCDRPLSLDHQRKLALFCNVPLECVIEAQDVPTIYQAPISYHLAGLDTQVVKYFNLQTPSPNLEKWERLCQNILYPERKVKIALVGKYISFPDTYKSLIQAIIHAGAAQNTAVEISWIDSEVFEGEGCSTRLQTHLENLQAVLIPGGFGVRGVEGKINAITFARLHKIPCLGICLGMQLMVVEGARTIPGFEDANSSEFSATPHPVVDVLDHWEKEGTRQEYKKEQGLGATMRLGKYPARLTPSTKAFDIYGSEEIFERHRHRYEVNLDYQDVFDQAGLVFSGLSPDSKLPEILERPDHPWFLGVQFHPELKSRPFEPHPLFVSFIKAALTQNSGGKKL